MSDTPTKIIVDCSTGEQKIVPLTPAEIAANDQAAAAAATAAQEKAAADAAAAAAKASAVAKLSSLGLTAEEIAALTA
jgi:hypothetical protein